MENEENLSKLQLLHERKVVTLFTKASNGGFHGREMTVASDPDGKEAIWFATAKQSRKVEEIQRDPNVIISAVDPIHRDKVGFFGIAQLVEDPGQKQKLWRPEWHYFFKQGPETPHYALIKIEIK